MHETVRRQKPSKAISVRCRLRYLAIGIVAGGRHQHRRRQGSSGMWASENEGAKFWLQVVTELKNRGVQGIFIACVDGLKGFPEAIETVFPKTQVQLCIVHLVRNSLKYTCHLRTNSPRWRSGLSVLFRYSFFQPRPNPWTRSKRPVCLNCTGICPHKHIQNCTCSSGQLLPIMTIVPLCEAKIPCGFSRSAACGFSCTKS